VDSADLAMIDILAHRGQMKIWIWTYRYRASNALDDTESLGALPLVNQTGDLAITTDARIDNRDELIAALALNDLPSEKSRIVN